MSAYSSRSSSGVSGGSGSSAAPQYLYGDTSHTPIALWNGDTGLFDQSGNGLDLTNGAPSTHGIVDVHTGQKAIYIGVGASLAVLDASLQLTGDVTTIWMGQIEEDPPSSLIFMSCSGSISSETEANNTLYNVKVLSGAARPRRIGANWEENAGDNVSLNSDSDNNKPSVPGLGQMMQVAMVRDSGDVSLYINGELIVGPTAKNLPTGGGSAQFLLGAAGPGSTTVASHYTFSAQVIGSALSTAQILAEYNRVMGPVHGLKS